MVQMNLTVSQAPERSGPVILSAAKDLAAGRDRPFAEFTLERSEGLRVTRYDCSNGQEPFVHIEPCLRTKGMPYSCIPDAQREGDGYL